MMLGAKIENGATVDAYVLPQGLTVASNKAALPQTPKTGEKVVVTKADGTVVNGASVSGKEITGLTGLNDGDIVYISGYAYSAPVDNMKMAIASDKFAGSFKMIFRRTTVQCNMQYCS